MLDFERGLYRVRPEFPATSIFSMLFGKSKVWWNFAQHKVTKLMSLVLSWLVSPRNPNITPCKRTQANRSPLHLVVLCRHALDALINVRVKSLLQGRNVDQFLPFFEPLQYAGDVARSSAGSWRPPPR